MRITVLTLFPELFENFVSTSIVGRSIERGLVSVDFVQIRDFALDRYKHVDDSPFGGGAGMVMKCQPVLDALHSVETEGCCRIMMTPSGTPYTQAKARELSKEDHLIILCGHYEGMDARIEKHMDEKISIGDYVLTGGEIPAMAVMDSVIRLLKGAIKEDSTSEESYENGLLEYPQYTQPADYEGDRVPEILLSGNHEKIRQYRRKESLRLTREVRPDLFEKARPGFTKEDLKLLRQLEEEEVQ